MFRYLSVLLFQVDRFIWWCFFFWFKNYYSFQLFIMQVQQQVIEVITYIASTATKFPKKCVVLCLLGGYCFHISSSS